MKKVRNLLGVIKREWPLEVSISLFLSVTLLLLFLNLDSLIGGGYSQSEVDVAGITNDLPSLIQNIAYYPYYLLVYLARTVIDNPVFAARSVSVGLGFISVLSIVLIIKRWFSTQIAIVGGAVFVSGSWFLQIARSGTPEIFGITAMLTIFASVLWLVNRPNKFIPSIVVALSVISGLFVPFLPVLMLGGLILAAVKERALLKIVPAWLYIVVAIAAVAGTVLLIFGLRENYEQTSTLLAIPSSLPSIGGTLSNLRETLAAIFWYAPTNPERWLANLPLLDIFGVVMVTLGVYRHERKFGTRRSLILFGGSVLLLIMMALNEGIASAGFTLLLPLAALFIISGIQEFLGLWQRIFPKNPFARGLAVMVISILVSMSSFYQLSRYFTAWANSPETREAYSARITE